jgi:N-acetylmuramoyl-L-alanine amidase
MSSFHTVVQGEHLSGIAKKYGFSSYKTIWDHGQNAELKKKRQNPNVLFPGDRLFIPDIEGKEESKNTEQKHRFELKTEKLKLRLVLEDQYEKPISSAPCEFHIENDVRHVTTDGKGKIEQDIPSTAESARLIIRSKETSLDDLIIPIKIGHLDPADEVTGQQARLANLGYFTGPIDGQDNPAFRLAVEEFQCDHGLPVDGICGPQTQAKLKDVHGC